MMSSQASGPAPWTLRIATVTAHGIAKPAASVARSRTFARQLRDLVASDPRSANKTARA